ncbi:MAG: LD-carboxypeptidase [Rectinemataceae bacterium]|nr:LD-carboxypeptidase [Rectinemataceae bacterium]
MQKLEKLRRGDKVAILSPSFAAPGMFPEVYHLGLYRLREQFGLEPVEYPTTTRIGASTAERTTDLIAAFVDPSIKAVIATIGGDDQVTYIKHLPKEPFANNPKPFFGFSDNSHFANFLWLQGIPSFYGGSIMTQYAMQGALDEYTVRYLKRALFETGECELVPSNTYNDQGYNWKDISLLNTKRPHWPNEGFVWDGEYSAEGILWGGCLESIDEMLRHNVEIPTLDQFMKIVLMLETSEEIPEASYVTRVVRALGERGILGKIKGILVGRAKAWEFNKPQSDEEKQSYKAEQRAAIIKIVRAYNKTIPIVQNMDFGHTDPQISMPYGGTMRIDFENRKIFARF